MRRKSAATHGQAVAIRQHLAADFRYLLGCAVQVGDERAAARFRHRIKHIESGAELHFVAWQLPDAMSGLYRPNTGLVLGADDRLKIDPDNVEGASSF